MIVQYSIIHKIFRVVNRFLRFGNFFLHFLKKSAQKQKSASVLSKKKHTAALICFAFRRCAYFPFTVAYYAQLLNTEGCFVAVTAIRTVIIYVMLIAAMRVMGRRQLGELQPIELVVTLLISDLASVPMQDSAIPLFSGLIPILVLVAAEILLSALMLKSPAFSSLVSGTPLLIIHNGKLNQQVLTKLRMSVEDLNESMRKQNIFDIRDVQTAIAETNGTVTVYPVAAKRPVVIEDLPAPPPHDHGMPLVVLADGKVCDWAMQACEIDEEWIDRTLQQEGYCRHEVMILTVNGVKDYHIIRKEIST